jgi:hypothetical protein
MATWRIYLLPCHSLQVLSGKAIVEVIWQKLQHFNIDERRIGCLVLGNANNDDTAVEEIIKKMGFDAGRHRLRHSPHTYRSGPAMGQKSVLDGLFTYLTPAERAPYFAASFN